MVMLTGCRLQDKCDALYRHYMGQKNGFDIWIIDGYRVRQQIYNEFLYGGNSQRYPFIPENEIWIDHAVSCEEYELTLEHELNERHLMAKFGWAYVDAHDSSLRLEISIRRSNERICRMHEAGLSPVTVTDYDTVKEIKDIPDQVKLQNIYRVPAGNRDGIAIWIVDGYLVRERIYPDFGFSGNDLAYHFIPGKEIWIDGQVAPEEMDYSIATELLERKLISSGKTYDDAYDSAITYCSLLRDRMKEKVNKQHLLAIPGIITRDTGVIDKNEK